jgi:DNA repair exonuclease SbcCD ATPase subunit
MVYYEDDEFLSESEQKFGYDKKGNFKPETFLKLGTPHEYTGERPIYDTLVDYPGVVADYKEYERVKIKINAWSNSWKSYAAFKFGGSEKIAKAQSKVFKSGKTEAEGAELEKKWKEDLAAEGKVEAEKLKAQLDKLAEKMSEKATKHKADYRAKAQANKDAKAAEKDKNQNAKLAKKAADIKKLEDGLKDLRKLEKDLVGLKDPKTQKKREMLQKKKDAINKKLDTLKSISESINESIIISFEIFQELNEDVDYLLDFDELY